MTLSRRERETAHGGAAVVLARSGEGLRCQPALTVTPHPFAQYPIAPLSGAQALSLWERGL
jgi:hypothetical protein